MAEAHLSSLLAFATSFISVRILEKPARRFGLVDTPGGRKHHVGEVALIGGLVTLVGVLVAASVEHHAFGMHVYLLAGCVVLLVTGLIDDRRDLGPAAKFAPQIVTALLMAVPAGQSVTDLGDLLGIGHIFVGAWAVVFTVFAVVGVINAFNLSDGLDGLAGGLAFIGLVSFAIVAYRLGLPVRYQMLLLFAGAVLGFLFFNLRLPWQGHAQIFLGDSGSMVLGFALAWFAVDLSQGERRAMPPVVALWVLALPIIDTISLMLRRLHKGQNPFRGGRDHLHHVLLHAGFSHCATVWILLSTASLMAAMGVGGWIAGVPEHWLFFGFVAIALTYHYVGVGNAWKFSWKLRRARSDVTGMLSPNDAGPEMGSASVRSAD